LHHYVLGRTYLWKGWGEGPTPSCCLGAPPKLAGVLYQVKGDADLTDYLRMMRISTVKRRSEGGFTLVELLVSMALIAVLATLSVQPLRTYWLRQGLAGASDDVATQLRSIQERVVSESHPLVYGASFAADSDAWFLLRYDPGDSTITTDDTCEVTGERALERGVVVSSVDFTAPPSDIVTACDAVTEAGDELVFFYARGSATGGQVTLRQPILDDTETITVGPITGRVTRS
jgi:prepilin-type N-terminal cleavage/methylation domain-containing protein